jgi:hypothetical protein
MYGVKALILLLCIGEEETGSGTGTDHSCFGFLDAKKTFII